MRGVFSLSSTGDWALISACGVLVFLLVISFRSRSTVFCQYLKAMTGISLAPRDVTREFKKGGQEGVRDLFLGPRHLGQYVALLESVLER